MCGILYAKNLKDDKPVNQTIKALYLSQKDRGADGFGYVGMTKDEIQHYKATEQKDVFAFLAGKQYDEILFHHRFPTSTKNTLQSTHPFACKWQGKTYYFIHNGIISNPEALKAQHAALGIKYTSQTKENSVAVFNDSEALAWDFVLWLTGAQPKARAKGSAALICLEYDEKKDHAVKLYFYHNDGSPMRYYQDTEILLISSETGDEIPAGQVYYYDYAEKIIKVLDKKYKVKYAPYTYVSGFNSYNPVYPYTSKAYGTVDYSVPSAYEDTITEEDYLEKKYALEREIRSIEANHSKQLIAGAYQEAEMYQGEIEDKKAELQELELMQIV